MPVTDGERVNVFDRRVIGAIDFDDRLLAFLESGQRRHLKGMLTGPSATAQAGAWLAAATVVDGAGVNDLTFGDLYGTDGNGEYISVAATDARITDVPFEDAAVTYYLAVQVAEVPEGVQVDTETGAVAYDYHRREIGHLAEPTVAVDSGGFITLTLGNHDLGTDDFTGRAAVVYLKTPVSTTAATAIETVVISGTTAVTVGTLGQSTVSVTASDYEVVLVGPTITRSISVATAASYAFIGTVIGGGSPRVFDTTGQAAVLSLGELSDMNDTLLSKGWTSTPPVVTLSGGGATATVTSTSTVFTQGRLLATPSGASFTSFPVSSDIWISYNVIAGDFAIYTTWDTADAGSNVPMYWARTDGASLITFVESATIARRVDNFPKSVQLTLGSEDVHGGAFRSFRDMLGHLGSLMDSASVPPRSFRVNVIGQVDVSASFEAVDTAAFFDVANVHFVGAESPDVTTPENGSVIQWTGATESLLNVPSGSSMLGWTFEGINFRHKGTPTAANVAVVTNAGTVSGLKFKGCTIGMGTFPGIVYNTGSLSDLAIIDCIIAVESVAVHSTVAATDGIDGLRISNSRFDQTGLTTVGSDAGMVRDLSTGGNASRRWRIQDNDAVLNGEFVIAETMDGAWIRDNDIEIVNVDARAIDIGVSAAGADVQHVWIHDNHVHYPGAAAFTLAGAVRVRSGQGTSTIGTGTLAGIFVHSNLISGTGYAAGNGKGLELTGTQADGMMVGMNMVRAFTYGAEVAGASGKASIMVGNVVEGGVGSYILGAGFVNSAMVANVGHTHETFSTTLNDTSGGENVMVGNLMSTQGTASSIAVRTDLASDDSVWVGNYIIGADAIIAEGSRCTWTGNLIAGDTTWVGVGVWAGNYWSSGAHDFQNENDLVIVGNYVSGDLTDVGAGTVVAGNRVNAVIFNEQRLVMVGNYIADSTSNNSFGSAADYIAITGNLWRDSPGFNATSQNWALTGNVFEGATAWSLDSNSGTVTGNLIRAALTLAAGSNDIALIGNRLLGGAPTDSGTSNTYVAATNDF